MLMSQPIFRCIDDVEWLCRQFVWHWSNFRDSGVWYSNVGLLKITPVLKSLHWLKINESIKYKLLSLTYKVLTTNQPQYLHNLISVQPCSTHVLHLWLLLLVHLPGPLWKSLIALLVCCTLSTESFILNLRLGFSANYFLHSLLPFLLD